MKRKRHESGGERRDRLSIRLMSRIRYGDSGASGAIWRHLGHEDAAPVGNSWSFLGKLLLKTAHEAELVLVFLTCD